VIKQEKNIGFYVTRIQYFTIQHKATLARVNISDYMRQMALYGQVKARWSEEERQLFKELIGMSNDLHQLVKIAQKEGIQSAVLHFSQFRDRIDQVLKLAEHDQ
jgi:hypothetical protein